MSIEAAVFHQYEGIAGGLCRRCGQEQPDAAHESPRAYDPHLDAFGEPPITPETAEPPTPLTSHLFVGGNPESCGICGKDRRNRDMHADWDYVPPMSADEMEDAHPFKGTGEKCEQCDRLPGHLIHGMHAPETGEPTLEERKVYALEEIAGALGRIEDYFRECTTTIDGGERVVRVWTHNRDRA